MLREHRAVFISALVLAVLLGPNPLLAAPTAEPGASLLFPYFEVELDEPDGLTTMFSVSNTSPQSSRQILAHAVIWSDWGIPVYSWDFYLAPGDVISYNLRDLLTYGSLPSTSPPAGFGAHCTAPLAPNLTPEALADLQRKLTGRPDPVGGLCSSEPREDGAIATGSITVDYVTDCAHDGIDDPFDAGYFDGSPPIAGKSAALVGDFFLVDPGSDLAEGFSAYPLHLLNVEYSFWGGIERADLRREPLSSNWRLRFLQGGPFEARTSFFVYHRRTTPTVPAACATVPVEAPECKWSFDVYEPSGHMAYYDLQVADQGRRTTGRVELDLPDTLLSGTVNFRSYYFVDSPVMGYEVDCQSLIFGAIEARGRFGAGIFGTPLN